MAQNNVHWTIIAGGIVVGLAVTRFAFGEYDIAVTAMAILVLAGPLFAYGFYRSTQNKIDADGVPGSFVEREQELAKRERELELRIREKKLAEAESRLNEEGRT